MNTEKDLSTLLVEHAKANPTLTNEEIEKRAEEVFGPAGKYTDGLEEKIQDKLRKLGLIA